MRTFLGALGEQHTVVREDPDWVPLDPGPAADERLTVEGLELVEPRSVDDARDQLARIELRPMVVGDDAVEIRRVDCGWLGRQDGPRRVGPSGVRVRDDASRDRQRVLVTCREVVGHSRSPRMHIRTAELLGADVLAGRSLHQRWAADEDRAGALDDHGLVAHRRDVRSAGRARPHDDGDLRDPLRRHSRLVEEDPSKMIAVGEDLCLERQERPTGVDEVDARQPILFRDFLRAEMLLDGEREVRSALHRRVVGHDHALATLDDADAGDDARARRLVVVDVERGKRTQLEKCRSRVDEQVDPVAGEELAAGSVTLARPLAAPHRDRSRAVAEL